MPENELGTFYLSELTKKPKLKVQLEVKLTMKQKEKLIIKLELTLKYKLEHIIMSNK